MTREFNREVLGLANNILSIISNNEANRMKMYRVLYILVVISFMYIIICPCFISSISN